MARTSRGSYDSDEAEFDLLRMRARRSPTDVSSYDEPANDDEGMDGETVIVRRPARLRRWTARFVGGLLLAGAIYGVSVAGARPEARRAMLEWVTLGHSDQARRAEDGVRRWVNDALQR